MENNLKNTEYKYIVYLTINKVNNKFYVGVHKTENPDIFDGYIGNGINIHSPKTYQKGKYLLHAAVRKYGINAFYRITISEFDSEEEALKLESLIVNENFIKNSNTYNLTLGGGKPPVQQKAVFQFNKNGVLIKKWESQIEAYKYYNLSKDVIRECIKNKRDCVNSYWSYEDTINISEYKSSTNPYRVFQYNELGELLKIFENAKEASIQLNIDKASIISSIFEHSKLYGCYFLKENEKISDILEEKKHLIISCKPVYRYKISGEFDTEFNSSKEACKKCHLNSGGLLRAIKNERIYHDYKWSFIKNETFPNYVKLSPVKVAQYDLNGNLIKIFDSVADCKKEFPYAQKVCRKQRKQYKGFVFKYIS